MSDTIGPDGLTDEERLVVLAEPDHNCPCWSCCASLFRTRLAAERLAHAETRAERDRLWSALEEVVCATEAADDGAAYRALTEARALLGEVRP